MRGRRGRVGVQCGAVVRNAQDRVRVLGRELGQVRDLLPGPFVLGLQFHILQGECHVCGDFLQETLCFLISGEADGHRDGQQTEHLPAVGQPDGYARPAAVRRRQGTVGTGDGGVFHDHGAGLGEGGLSASWQASGLQAPGHWLERLAETGLGPDRQRLGLVPHGNPGIVVTPRADKRFADLPQERIAVGFLHDELVDVADGLQHGVEVFDPVGCPLAPGGVVFDFPNDERGYQRNHQDGCTRDDKDKPHPRRLLGLAAVQ